MATPSRPQRLVHLTGDKENPAVPVTVEPLGDDRFRVLVDGRPVEVEAFLSDGKLTVREGAATRDLAIERRGETFLVPGKEGRVSVHLQDARIYEMQSVLGGGPGSMRPELVSPMAGKVVLVRVAAGDEVAEGQTLVIIEAMKMENELRAQAAVKVREVRVVAGQVVSPGEVLVTFEV